MAASPVGRPQSRRPAAALKRPPAGRREWGRRVIMLAAVNAVVALFLPWMQVLGSGGIGAFDLDGALPQSYLQRFGVSWLTGAVWIVPVLAAVCVALTVLDRFRSVGWGLAATAALGGAVVGGLGAFAFFMVLPLRQLGPLGCAASGAFFAVGAWFAFAAPWLPPARPGPGERLKAAERPWVTYAIVALCVAVHALLGWRSDYPEIVREWGLIAGSVRVHALFTHMFLHGSVLHLAGNMVVLLAVGSVLERRVGRVAFAAVYFLGGLAGAGASILIDPRIFAAGIGASGAVFAVMALCIVVAPWARLKIWMHFLVAAGRIEVPAAWAFAVGAVLQAFGAVRLAVGSAGPVGYWSHIGGLALGLAAGALLRATRLVRPETPASGEADVAAADRDGSAPTSTAAAAARLGRVRPRRASRDIVLPYAVVGISLALSVAAAVATLNSGSLLGVLAGFQRAWNSGELSRVERYFKEGSRQALSDQFRQLVRRVEGGSTGSGRTGLRISLSDACQRGDGYAARFLCAPPGKDPHRSRPGEVGMLEIWLSKESGRWRVSGMTLRNVGG